MTTIHRQVTACDLSQRAAEHSMRDTESAFYINLHRVAVAVQAHAAVVQMASHQNIGRERAEVIAWREQEHRVCHGLSCNQHRRPCTEGCPTLAEMACAEPEPDMPSLWRRLWAWLKSPNF